MLRRISMNYHKNYYKVSDDNDKILKTVDLYQKKITYENINERLIRFFLKYKNDFDFLNEIQHEFLRNREANIYGNYLKTFKRNDKGMIREESIRINSLDKEYRVKYLYNDFFDLLQKEISYAGEMVCVIKYIYENGRLECIRKLDLNNFDSEGSYFNLEENIDFEYYGEKLSKVKFGEEEFFIEYIGDVDIIAKSEKRRFEFKLGEKLLLKRIKTYIYYEENNEIKEVLFMEKEFFYENNNLIKRVMKIEKTEYTSEYLYNKSGIMSQIITRYNGEEIYKKSFDSEVTEREVFQKYEDNKAYALKFKDNSLNIEIPENYLNEELEIFIYDKQSVEKEMKTGRLYVTEEEIMKNQRLYDTLTFLSSRTGVEKYDNKDYMELDFFQKDNILILDPRGRNIIFFKTKWYI
jgi:hypothetical protein